MKTTYKTLVLVIETLAVMLLYLGCSDVSINSPADVTDPGNIMNQKHKVYESFSYDLNLTGQTTVRAENINGEINVQSVTGTNKVSISGEKIVSSDTYQDAYSQLKNITINVNELTSEVVVKTEQPNFSGGRSYTVNYTISVPANISLFVTNVNGKLSGQVSVPTNGTVDMKLQNGNIILDIPESTSAEFFASQIIGTISTQNLVLYNKVRTGRSLQGRLGDGDGTITLRTTNGNIDVSGF